MKALFLLTLCGLIALPSQAAYAQRGRGRRNQQPPQSQGGPAQLQQQAQRLQQGATGQQPSNKNNAAGQANAVPGAAATGQGGRRGYGQPAQSGANPFRFPVGPVNPTQNAQGGTTPAGANPFPLRAPPPGTVIPGQTSGTPTPTGGEHSPSGGSTTTTPQSVRVPFRAPPPGTVLTTPGQPTETPTPSGGEETPSGGSTTTTPQSVRVPFRAPPPGTVITTPGQPTETPTPSGGEDTPSGGSTTTTPQSVRVPFRAPPPGTVLTTPGQPTETPTPSGGEETPSGGSPTTTTPPSVRVPFRAPPPGTVLTTPGQPTETPTPTGGEHTPSGSSTTTTTPPSVRVPFRAPPPGTVITTPGQPTETPTPSGGEGTPSGGSTTTTPPTGTRVPFRAPPPGTVLTTPGQPTETPTETPTPSGGEETPSDGSTTTTPQSVRVPFRAPPPGTVITTPGQPTETPTPSGGEETPSGSSTTTTPATGTRVPFRAPPPGTVLTTPGQPTETPTPNQAGTGTSAPTAAPVVGEGSNAGRRLGATVPGAVTGQPSGSEGPRGFDFGRVRGRLSRGYAQGTNPRAGETTRSDNAARSTNYDHLTPRHFHEHGAWHQGDWQRWNSTWGYRPWVVGGSGIGANWLGFGNAALAAPWTWGYYTYWNPYWAPTPGAVNYYADYSRPIVAAALPEEVADNTTQGEAQAAALFDVARQQFRRGNYQQALNSVDRAAALYPNDAMLHEFRALCLFALGDYQTAAAALYSVLSVGPGWDWATMVGLYPDVAVYTNQLRALEGFRRENADSAPARFVLAYHYLVTDHGDAAARELQQVVALVPDDQLSTQLLSGLVDKQPAVAAPPEPMGDVTAASLVGNWTAQQGEGGPTFKLDLAADQRFTWLAALGDQQQQISGTYTVEGNHLVLDAGQGNSLVGQVAMTGADELLFKLAGNNPADPGLKFTK